MNECMDGWVDGWMGGWMNGWMDGWIDGYIDGWMHGWMDNNHYFILQILGYITDLHELKAYTPAEHVDYASICDSISELEMIQKV